MMHRSAGRYRSAGSRPREGRRPAFNPAPRPAPHIAWCAGLLVFLILVSGVGRAAMLETAEFVVSVSDGQGNSRSVISNVVPYLPERACFGWRIRLADRRALVRYREVLKLPQAPKFWSGENDAYSPHSFSADRTTATTEEFAAPDKEGWIASSWCIAAGDPTGPHSIDVFIDGQLAKHFDFEVKIIGEAKDK